MLTWTSVSGARYKVQYSTTLIPPAPWQDFEVVTAASAMSSSEVPLALLGAGAPNEGFYRLVLPQPASRWPSSGATQCRRRSAFH